jgi:cytochrome b
MKQLRLWHAFLALLAIATYLSGEMEPVHMWLGYALVAMIGIRLVMALLGARPLGLQRFYPQFADLRLGTLATNPAISRTLLLGIALSLIGATATGVIMDKGEALQARPELTIAALFQSDDDENEGRDEGRDEEREGRGAAGGEEEDGDGEGLVSEIHELFANALLALVGLHVGYLLLFKWPLARFMLFIRQRGKAA